MASNEGDKKIDPDTSVHITYEDQLRINTFAHKNSAWEEITEQVELNKIRLRNLEDGVSELDMVLDDDELIPFQLGDLFIYSSLSECQEKAQLLKKKLKTEIEIGEQKRSKLKEEIIELKTLLYSVFGNKINLEPDKDD